jgi:chemotaxis protein methyltransferase CheR
MAALPITPQLFAILSALIEERVGIHYTPDDAGLLADKLTPRALDRGFDSLLDYYYFLRYDENGVSELDALTDALVVNETYFFREVDQLNVLVDLLAAAPGRVRVWCAASSTGEEPLTLAMLLDERGLLPRVDLVASDVSVRALSRARGGLYRGRSLRALAEPYRSRYFRPDGDMLRIDPRIQNAVDYRKVNLIDDAAVAKLGTFDAVLCRNVLIYFRDDRIRRVVGALTGRLEVGGHLLVGASESLLRFSTSLTCIERGGVFLYRRGAL